MRAFRIALGNVRIPVSPDDSVVLAQRAVVEASDQEAGIICFPECFVPGYRVAERSAHLATPEFLKHAWATIAATAAAVGIAVVLGTERVTEEARLLSAVVINPDGTIAGFQDKVQLDPSEERRYSPGQGRHIFQVGPLRFGIVICHEGWRYPETVRWAARHGAQLVFHPHYDETEPGAYPPAFGDPANSFHEKAILCRAAENTCYFASVNCAAAGSATTSAIARPDGTLLACQPYGQAGLLIADIDLDAATGLLAARLRSTERLH